MTTTFKRRTRTPDQSEYTFFTAVETKSADFAIYYNVALDTCNRIKDLIAKWPPSRQYAYWAEFLWKAHLLNKNSNGYELLPQHERIINGLLAKVEEIRNYHSHIWHDNNVLAFDEELKDFIIEKYEEAKADLYSKFPSALVDYETLALKPKMKKFELFKKVKEKNRFFITPEGRIFFLSFFLTSGQMNQFLQQRTGSKRSDIPLFKIKRLLYTYYCHRDGATMSDFNHEERFIDTVDANEKNDIFKARTAYKLLSYLFDYPWYWGSRKETPLYNKEGEIIKDVEQLQKYIVDTGILPGLQFQLIEKEVSFHPLADSLKEHEEHLKHQEDKHRMGTIAFNSSETVGHSFHMDFDTLHRLVLLQMLYNQNEGELSPLEILKENIKVLVSNREMLCRILLTQPAKRTPLDNEYLFDKKNQHLRGGRRLTELGIRFFESLQKEEKESRRDAYLLANFLRNENADFNPLPMEKKNQMEVASFAPEPIHVYQQDILSGASQKFRSGNRFMHYSAKYLMDFTGDQWYWGMEKFDLVRKDKKARTESLLKVKSYLRASELHSKRDYRLTLENDHIYLAIPKNNKNGANHDKFYQFAIGPQAMRYLMAYLINHKNEFENKLHDFLQSLADDLEIMHQKGNFIPGSDYKLLEKKFVMGYLQNNQGNVEKLRQQIVNRIDHILEKWENALGNNQYLSRSAKNRLIMDAYRLFDWPKGNDGNPRFLRAAEYNEMSVCHYSLHKKEDSNKRSGGHKRLKNKFEHLYYDLFQFQNRKPPIPREIITLTQNANSLDNLMEIIIENRSVYLNTLKSKILGQQSPQKQKHDINLQSICRKLGISIPPNVLEKQEQATLLQKHKVTMTVQPYAIHPGLIIKYFFPEEHNREPIKHNTDKTGKLQKSYAAIPIFANIRKNKGWRDKLVGQFYDTNNLDKLYSSDTQKKQKEDLTGIMNTTCTEDILLWWMCTEYLSNNKYTQNMGAYIAKQKNTGRKYVGEFHQLPVVFPLQAEGQIKPVYIEILVHQIDDLMFNIQKSRLGKAAVHFITRCNDKERQIWSESLQILVTNQLGGAELPDGSHKKPIPFKLLIDELELVRRTGMELAKYMLQFEKKVLETASKQHNNNEHSLHQWLKSEYSKTEASTKFPAYHFNFENILKLANSTGLSIDENTRKLMNEYRNITFHNDVPVEGSFSYITRAGQSLRKILNIENDLHAKKDRSIYMERKN